jgi:hypothetical protein
VVRTIGPTGVGWWLAIAGILLAAAGAIGCAWWLIRHRQRRVPQR